MNEFAKRHRPWAREELIRVLALYWVIPFGRQDRRDPEVIALALRLGRTPSSVAMKLNNLTSLDASERARGVRGLTSASRLDRQVWEEFEGRPAVLVDALAELDVAGLAVGDGVGDWGGATGAAGGVVDSLPVFADGDATSAVVEARRRIGQGFFRRSVSANFGGRCAMTGVSEPRLLRAGHIKPWARATDDERLSAENGLLLNALCDAAFDSGIITLDERLRVVVSARVREVADGYLQRSLLAYEGVAISAPQRHAVSPVCLAYHRAQVFQG